MIVVKLMGGLGNQMFQYAAGRALALKHNTELKLDLGFLLDRTPKADLTFRDYELDVFTIKCEVASKEDIQKLIPLRQGILFKIRQRLGLTKVVKEVPLKNNHRFFSASDNTYLSGYWQSERYFKEFESQIRKDFTVKPEFKNLFHKEFEERVKSCNSVALHIRRGDYVSNKITNQHHGTCSLDYYNRAVEVIKQKVINPHIFVFSDDLKWAKENLKFDMSTEFVEGETGNRSFEDLYLMSLCKHNIIANSSYSWWGAWLNCNNNKIVVAPGRWFVNNKINLRRLNSLPKSWVII